MGLFFTILSLVLAFFSPSELFPTLAAFHLQQFVMGIAVVVSILLVGLRPDSLSWTHCALVVGLMGAMMASWVSKAWFGGALMCLWSFGPSLLIFFLVHINAMSLKRIKLMGAVISLSAIIMAVQGILAYHTGYMFDELTHPTEIGGLVRIRGLGFLNDANDFAQFLLIGLALLGLFWKKGKPIQNGFLVVAGAVLVYATYLTYSRGAIFGLLTIFAVAFARKGSYIRILVLAACLFVAMIALQFGGGRDVSIHEGSAAERVMAWGSGITMLKEHPIFGVGYTAFTEHNDLTAHNSFVLCFAELGFFGYFFFLALLVVTAVSLQRASALPIRGPDDQAFASSLKAVRAAFFVFVVTSYFLSRTYAITLYFLLGFAASMIQMRQKDFPQITLPIERWLPITLVSEVLSVILIYATIRIRIL